MFLLPSIHEHVVIPYLFCTLTTLFYCLICGKEEQETKITIEEFLFVLPVHQYQIKYIL